MREAVSRIVWALGVLALAGIGVCGVPGALDAHPLSVSYSHWVVESHAVQVTIRVPQDDMDLLLRLDTNLGGTVSKEEIDAARERIGRYIAERVRVASEGEALVPSVTSVSEWRDRENFPHLEAQLAYSSSKIIDAVELKTTLLTDLYPAHRTVADITVGDRRMEFVFQHGSTIRVGRTAGSVWETSLSFLVLGFEHILTGYDHILFLFGLLLVGRGFRQLVAIVTAFTVAHSATLSLATFGVLEPTVWAVEAAIALSIAYVGVENLASTSLRHRWRIAFVFGLIHGFGFANILRDMELPRSSLALSLVTFNAGVEVGQVAIVAVLWPALCFLQRTRYHQAVTRYGSVAVVVMGLYWFCQRVL